MTEILSTDGTDKIRSERLRQIYEEGWTMEHDSLHTSEQLAFAAACYAAPTPIYRKLDVKFERVGIGQGVLLVNPWPWAPKWDKRIERFEPPLPLTYQYEIQTRTHELAKAGALIAAEIDRLLQIVKDRPYV